jgi:hypothetical protein
MPAPAPPPNATNGHEYDGGMDGLDDELEIEDIEAK